MSFEKNNDNKNTQDTKNQPIEKRGEFGTLKINVPPPPPPKKKEENK